MSILAAHPTPSCVAVSPDYYKSARSSPHGLPVDGSPRGVTWSADGTCLLMHRADYAVQTYVVPPDLLDPNRTSPHELAPYFSYQANEAIYAITGHPSFNLSDLSTTLALSSIREHPVRLFNALWKHTAATYRWFDVETESCIAPHSLLFSREGTRFVAGARNQIAVFDVNREEGPSHVLLKSSAASKSRRRYTSRLKGIVSTLHSNSDRILAAGTFTRGLALYGNDGLSEEVATWSLNHDHNSNGAGITQVHWSDCGKYLFVAERNSDTIIVYDVRVAGTMLGKLVGRCANTSQRMSIQAITWAGKQCVIAGGTDGTVRMWFDPWTTEGSHTAAFTWPAHNDVVCSALMHPVANVIATLGGSRTPSLNLDLSSDSDDDRQQTPPKDAGDAALSIWSL